jgi:prepilin-type N-terminal cleavage/methylation domain-containing protein
MKSMQMRSGQTGFTLIELLIVIAIIGILAAIAVPAYQDYITKSRYTEVTNGVTPFKTGVEDCFQAGNAIADCDHGANGVPAQFSSAAGAIATISVANGVITATPNVYKNIVAADTLILSPSSAPGAAVVAPVPGQKLYWIMSGGAVTKGWVKN